MIQMSEIGTIDYAANQTKTIELPRNYGLRELRFRLDASLTRTLGTAGTIKDVSPAQLVKRIQVVGNGRKVIKTIDLETLHRQTEYNFGVRPAYSGLTSGYTAISTALACQVSARMSFAMPRARRRKDTLLDTTQFTTLHLIVTFGTANEVMTSDYDGAVTVASAQLRVSSVEEAGIDANDGVLIHQEYGITKDVTADNPKFQIPLSVGFAYRRILVKAVAAGVPVNTLIDKITLRSGSYVYMTRDADLLKDDNLEDYRLPADVPGYYALDFVHDGQLTKSLPTDKITELTLEMDVDKSTSHGSDECSIEVWVQELVPAARKSA